MEKKCTLLLGAVPSAPRMPSPVLSHVLESIRRHRSDRPVVLFDLDGTLYDNRPRTQRILHAFAAQLEHAHARDAEIIRGIGYKDLDYRLEDTLAVRGVSRAVIDRAKAAWQVKFFSDAACSDDIPIAGSVHFVRACWDSGATVVYLTGRDIPGMLLGTCRTLRDDGFPIAIPRVELVMKPTFEEGDSEFKQRLLDMLGDLGRIVASFDNEPANCNLFCARWPEASVVLLDTQRAPGSPPLHERASVLRDFDG